jgi:hypothetical protein
MSARKGEMTQFTKPTKLEITPNTAINATVFVATFKLQNVLFGLIRTYQKRTMMVVVMATVTPTQTNQETRFGRHGDKSNSLQNMLDF